MALVKYGGGIIQMSGSIAGNTFARNRYGNYVRAKTKPVNPNTIPQQRIRGIIAYLTEVWYTILTAPQRAGWKLYADNVAMKNKLGETIKLSGFNHYIRSNACRLYFYRFVVNAPPTNFTLPDHDATLTIDVDDTPQKIIVTFNEALAWRNENGGKMFMRMGRPQNPTRNFFAGPWTLQYMFDGAPANGDHSPKEMVPVYAVAEGQRVWCTFRISRADGRLSEPFTTSAIVHGQAPGEVPMLIGLTQPEAEVKLTTAQLILGTVTTENSETVPVDRIISSDPIAHTRLAVGDPVNIVISLGPAV